MIQFLLIFINFNFDFLVLKLYKTVCVISKITFLVKKISPFQGVYCQYKMVVLSVLNGSVFQLFKVYAL